MNKTSEFRFKDVIKSALPYLKMLSFALVILLSLLGFYFSESDKLMYNIIIMPTVGALGYGAFKKRAIYMLPAIILFTDLFAHVTGLVSLDLYSTVIWSLIYCFLAFLGFVLTFLFVYGFKKKDGRKTVTRVISIILAILLCGVLGLFVNGLIGNPVSRAIATNTAKKHLEESYANTDFVVESVTYDFKSGGYYAYVSSQSSIDSYFSIDIAMNGKLINDSYEDMVASKRNTSMRLGQDYRSVTNAVLESKMFPYDAHIAFGELIFADEDHIDEAPKHAIPTKSLVLDKFYDIDELGARSGELTVYIYDDKVDAQRLSEILLGIRKAFDDAGVKFYVIDCVLESPRDEGAMAEGERIEVMNFLYSDIYEDGLVDRVKASDNAAKEYYESMDK